MRALQMLTKTGWRYVFCYSGNTGEVVCTDDVAKALPGRGPCNREHAADDLAFFSKRFGNDQFRLVDVPRGRDAAGALPEHATQGGAL